MVEVTQADREAASHTTASYHYGQSIMRGDEDNKCLVQAFAHHRVNVLRSLADNPAMVERVARALCVSNGDDPDSIGEGRPMWCHWFDEAKAALRAIGGVE